MTGLRLYLGCFCKSSRVGAPGEIAAEDAAENFGRALDLNADGTVVVVGARDNDDGGANSGETRVFAVSGASCWGSVCP